MKEVLSKKRVVIVLFFCILLIPNAFANEIDEILQQLDERGLDWTQDEIGQIENLLIPYTYGDSNHDGKKDITDAIFIFKHLFLDGRESSCLRTEDVNNDGKVDLTDGIYLLNYLFQGGPAPLTNEILPERCIMYPNDNKVIILFKYPIPVVKEILRQQGIFEQQQLVDNKEDKEVLLLQDSVAQPLEGLVISLELEGPFWDLVEELNDPAVMAAWIKIWQENQQAIQFRKQLWYEYDVTFPAFWGNPVWTPCPYGPNKCPYAGDCYSSGSVEGYNTFDRIDVRKPENVRLPPWPKYLDQGGEEIDPSTLTLEDGATRIPIGLRDRTSGGIAAASAIAPATAVIVLDNGAISILSSSPITASEIGAALSSGLAAVAPAIVGTAAGLALVGTGYIIYEYGIPYTTHVSVTASIVTAALPMLASHELPEGFDDKKFREKVARVITTIEIWLIEKGSGSDPNDPNNKRDLELLKKMIRDTGITYEGTQELSKLLNSLIDYLSNAAIAPDQAAQIVEDVMPQLQQAVQLSKELDPCTVVEDVADPFIAMLNRIKGGCDIDDIPHLSKETEKLMDALGNLQRAIQSGDEEIITDTANSMTEVLKGVRETVLGEIGDLVDGTNRHIRAAQHAMGTFIEDAAAEEALKNPNFLDAARGMKEMIDQKISKDGVWDPDKRTLLDFLDKLMDKIEENGGKLPNYEDIPELEDMSPDVDIDWLKDWLRDEFGPTWGEDTFGYFLQSPDGLMMIAQAEGAGTEFVTDTFDDDKAKRMFLATYSYPHALGMPEVNVNGPPFNPSPSFPGSSVPVSSCDKGNRVFFADENTKISLPLTFFYGSDAEEQCYKAAKRLYDLKKKKACTEENENLQCNSGTCDKIGICTGQCNVQDSEDGVERKGREVMDWNYDAFGMGGYTKVSGPDIAEFDIRVEGCYYMKPFSCYCDCDQYLFTRGDNQKEGQGSWNIVDPIMCPNPHEIA